MANFLRRFFLFFFPILACLFLVSLLMPVAAFARATGSLIRSIVIASGDTDTCTYNCASDANTDSGSFPHLYRRRHAVPTPAPTATAAPTPTPIPTATPTAVPSPTPTMVPTPGPTATPTPGGNTNATGAHTALNALIFTMGGAGVLLVIVGVILYFVYSRSI